MTEEPADSVVVKFDSKTDTAMAAEYYPLFRACLTETTRLMNELERKHGLRVAFQIGRDGFGRNSVMHLEIVKVL